MASTNPDQELMKERHAKYAAALHAQDVDHILAFMSDDVILCDYSVGQHNLLKPAIRTYFHNVFSACENFTITSLSLNGNANFTCHEWKCTFNYMKPAEEGAGEEALAADKADGREIKMVCVSLMWWDEGGNIVKIHDYGKVVEEFIESK